MAHQYPLCALTGLPLRTRDPFVALPVTGRAGRFAVTAHGDSCADWGPRMPPVRGVVDGWNRYDAGQGRELAVWAEGFQVDAATPKHLGDWTVNDRVRVWPLGVPTRIPRWEPTPRRVARMLADRGLPTGEATAPVRPFVFVKFAAPTPDDASAWALRVEKLARDNAWRVTYSRVEESTARVHIGPQSVDAVVISRTLPYQSGETEPPRRRSHPVALCLVHRRAWERACVMGEVDHIAQNVEHITLRDDVPPWAGPVEVRPAVSRALALIAALDLSGAGWRCAEDIRALSTPAPGTLGVLWALGRALQGASPVRTAVRGIAEILAVDLVMRVTGRRWAPSHSVESGFDSRWDHARAMVDVTREIAQGLADEEPAG